ncbi:MAG: DUF1211 domain-containing protein [Bacteroidia bacterium]|nr:DUF1211 domain-containing protein [Bacteroidia bacterium]
MKVKDSFFPTQRTEALSDGVIAIIITLMILEVKSPKVVDGKIADWPNFLHHLIAFAMSFLMLGIYWVNHHNFFHKLKHGDRKLLWLNLNLLFWLSLIPIPTDFLGANYKLPIASVFYGIVLFASSISFTIMGSYAGRKGMFVEQIPDEVKQRNMRRNRLGLALYAIAMGTAFISVYISYAIFIFVAAMYFMPRLGIEPAQEDLSIPEAIAENLYRMETKIEGVIDNTLHAKHKPAPTETEIAADLESSSNSAEPTKTES